MIALALSPVFHLGQYPVLEQITFVFWGLSPVHDAGFSAERVTRFFSFGALLLFAVRISVEESKGFTDKVFSLDPCLFEGHHQFFLAAFAVFQCA